MSAARKIYGRACGLAAIIAFDPRNASRTNIPIDTMELSMFDNRLITAMHRDLVHCDAVEVTEQRVRIQGTSEDRTSSTVAPDGGTFITRRTTRKWEHAWNTQSNNDYRTLHAFWQYAAYQALCGAHTSMQLLWTVAGDYSDRRRKAVDRIWATPRESNQWQAFKAVSALGHTFKAYDYVASTL